MKKRGFTLIELLAVIVVLAIIALIATPIVMNVIKNAQLGAAERSAERYLDAVELATAQYRLNNNEALADGEYTVDENGNLVGATYTLTVEVTGDKPDAGSKVVIANGQVVSSGTTLNYAEAYTVTLNEEGKAEANEIPAVVAACTVESGNGTNLGDEIKCGDNMFRVLKNDGTNVTMLASESIGQSKFSDTAYWKVAEYDVNAPNFGVDSKYPWRDISVYVYDNNSSIYSILLDYQEELSTVGVKDFTAKLPSSSDMYLAGCDQAFWTCSDAQSWATTGNFWLGEAGDVSTSGTPEEVWYVSGGNYWYSVYSDIRDVRPVVVMSTENI